MEVCAEVEKNVGQPLAVEVKPLLNFYSAEEYHQKYLDKNPGGYCHIPVAMMHLK
jgi:peptide methionine sulfoxide reductase MsrA